MQSFYFYPFVSLLLVTYPLIATAADDIALNMYFFPEENPELILANETTPDSEPEMHMTIFTADEEQINAQERYVDDNNDEFSFFYYLDTGYQNDTVSWSISSPTGRPNVLTEVEWKDVSLFGLNVGFTIDMPYGLVLKGDGGYAWTYAGDSREVNYLRDNRSAPWSDVSSDSDKGYALFGSIALGYAFDFDLSNPVSFNFTPLAGYAWRKQNLNSINGKERSTRFNLTDPERLKLENSYTARWFGPWLGADMTLTAYKHHQLFSSFQHHWADYKAKAFWRRAIDFRQPGSNAGGNDASFEHRTDATGIVVSTGYRYITDDLWGLSVSFKYENWESERGNETSFSQNNVYFDTPLNAVERESFGVNFGLNMQF